MIACYCRVSSVRQKTDSQKPEIQRWLQGNGIDPATADWFEDKETGWTLNRPAFDRLQKAIFAGRVKMVVVWKLDRISRRQRDGVNLLAEWCECGVRVVAVTQQIDLGGAVGRMVASVLFGLAEIESEYRRERQIERALIRSRGGRLKLELGEAKQRLLQKPAASRVGDDPSRVLTLREIKHMKRANIERAVARCNGQVYGKDGAAALLGMKSTTLWSRDSVAWASRRSGPEGRAWESVRLGRRGSATRNESHDLGLADHGVGNPPESIRPRSPRGASVRRHPGRCDRRALTNAPHDYRYTASPEPSSG